MAKDVLELVAGIVKSAASKPSAKKPKKEIVINNVVQLPIWPEPTRGMPNTIARSALFNVRFKKTPRIHIKSQLIAALSGIQIEYTGEELRQNDETVFLQLLHLARLQPLGEPVKFTPYSFLKAIKWPTSGGNHYQQLADCIDRMDVTQLKIKKDDVSFSNSLIRKTKIYDNSKKKNRLKEWNIWLEPEIVQLFQSNDYSRVEWEQRLKLKKPLAQWLHSFYTGHEKPFPMKVSTIHNLCDSSAKKLSGFRGTLKSSLEDLVSKGFLLKWWIDDTDKVHVVRT